MLKWNGRRFFIGKGKYEDEKKKNIICKKISVNEMSLSMKCLIYEMSCLWNDLSIKCLSIKCLVYEMSFYEMSFYEISCYEMSFYEIEG